MASAYAGTPVDSDFKLAAAVRDGLFLKSDGGQYSRNEKDSVHLRALSKQIQDPEPGDWSRLYGHCDAPW